MRLRAADPSAEVLEPKLTAWDRRVLSKLEVWPERYYALPEPREPLRWLDVWEVARRLRSNDVEDVRRTLDGLVRFGYASDNGYDHRKCWIATPWKGEHHEQCSPLTPCGHPEHRIKRGVFEPWAELLGKEVNGTTSCNGVVWLEFTDGSELRLTAVDGLVEAAFEGSGA